MAPPPGLAIALAHWTSNYPTRTNADLVGQLKARGLITHSKVERALASIDRANYVPKNQVASAYEDRPLPIGHGATISAPHMHATCLELLVGYLRPDSNALDVGSGSGYLAAAMAMLMADGGQPQGKVLGVEHLEELVRDSERNIATERNRILDRTVVLRHGDGRLGDAEHAPYTAIHVGAASQGIPEELVRQLAVGGRMVVPVEEEDGQYLTVVDKVAEGEVQVSRRFRVTYVPLTDESHYRSGRWRIN